MPTTSPADSRPSPTPTPDCVLSVVIPVFNERYLVRELLSRLEGLEIDGIDRLEILVIDDASNDGTSEVLDQIAEEKDIRLLRHEKNRGKGAAVRTGIAEASGDFIIFQDADLEYDPRDYQQIMRPFFEDGADVVYGSRYLAGQRRRILQYRHSMGNRLITAVSNLFTDLDLTDVETCYKAFRAPLLKSLPLRSNDFAIEPEVTAKVAKRRFRIFEVPISYLGRTYQEGKKIGWRDGVKAMLAIVRFWLQDDIYAEDDYGSHILHSLEKSRNFNHWMTTTVGRKVGSAVRVMELGAGIGNMTGWLIPRELYVAGEINPQYLHYLSNFAYGKPYLKIERLDLEDAELFEPWRESVEAVICLNVLEHVGDPVGALRNVHSVLEADGRVFLYVPQDPKLYSPLDKKLGHRCRYTREELRSELDAAGFVDIEIQDFNRFGRLGWWWTCKVRKRLEFGRVQLKIFDTLVPILRRIDRLWPWRGLGLIATARKPDVSREASSAS